MFSKADQTMMRSNTILSLPVLLLIWAGPASAYQKTSQPVVAPKPQTSEYFLGVFTDSLRELQSLPKAKSSADKQGVIVTYVLPASPAAKAGIKPNDILLDFDQKSLSSPQELKRLVTRSASKRPVTVKLKRKGEPVSVDVQLAKRILIGATSPTSQPLFYGPAIVRLKNRNDATVCVPLDKMLIPGSDFLWCIHPSTPKPATPLPSAPVKTTALNQAITISTSDGNSFQLKVSQTDIADQSSVFEWEGTEEEIQQKVETAPAKVATDVRSSLNWARTQVSLKRGLRFQVQPRLEGSNQILRVLMSRSEKDGSIRLFYIDHFLKNIQTTQADVLLKIEPIASEIKNLPTVVREKMESTLRNTRLPVVRVDVQRSQ